MVPDLCLNTKNYQYCALFSETYFYKNVFASCLKVRMKMVNSKVVLINNAVGCFKIPPDSKLSWKEILFSNKTLTNIELMNRNVANWIL
jgi:hypothetical protein